MENSASPSMAEQQQSSHFTGGNADYIEFLYEQYLSNPTAVPQQWRVQFEKLPTTNERPGVDDRHSEVRDYFRYLAKNKKHIPQSAAAGDMSAHERKQIHVQDLIASYRRRGHKIANIDPLQLMERDPMPVLDLSYHRLTPADLQTVFLTGDFAVGDEPSATLEAILEALKQTYCRTLGAEYLHVVDSAELTWVQDRLERSRAGAREHFDADTRKRILERLSAAEGFEKYLQNRYPGVKRFGLEGGETLIPMLYESLQRAGSLGCVETVIGMAHRGRLNVLVNILGKLPKELFDEFEGKAEYQGSGDVKYHQGFSCNLTTPGGEMHVALGFNPSHLEIVDPVVEGSVRARQDRRGDYNHDLVVPILLHGDASFAGQGVVMETLQMSQTRGFKTGGTIHLIINNQVGFTTHRREDARSTEYCSEVAKMVQAPILHVNGDDPEAAVFAAQMAVDYRMRFKKDIVIDLVCYRRRGHNEAEEPAKTQPLMYQAINKHPTTRAIYARHLIRAGLITSEEEQGLTNTYTSSLESDMPVALSLVKNPDKSLYVNWTPYIGHDSYLTCDTSIDKKSFQEIAAKLDVLPEGFSAHRQVRKILEDRRAMAAGEKPANWGFAEIMAYGTLLAEGHSVRLTGQDVGVGTFSHRHACLHDQNTGARFIPLSDNLAEKSNEAFFDIYDSLLSEEAVLAYEYGYSTTNPKVQVIWEAQFGDFANGAQVVIDQFISSGEAKWQRLAGLTMLLPHGYEGAGPEHSSARLERYMQLCAEQNIQVCVPTTPAQVFHMLRRQIMRPLRKPLIVMTPKSLLRHKLAISSIDELCESNFHPVLGEIDELEPEQVKRVVMCSGKVYYDLLEKRREAGAADVAIIRLEQLYPFPETELQEILHLYQNLEVIYWCQEEPMNQGAWYCSQHHMRRVAMRHDERLYLFFAGRRSTAAPAGGYMAAHKKQQADLVEQALFG